jgi:hypothetical protein
MGVEAALIGGGAMLGSSLIAGRSASKAASSAANAQLEAARIAAEEQRFRPVGVTTRFGQSQFGFDPEGRLTSAGYTASPEIQALQDRLSALYGTSLGQAEQAQALGMPIGAAGQGLFNLGQQYMAQSPEQARQQFMAEQYALLDPVRQREEQRLGAGVFGRGRAGLNVGDIGQPELFALASARRQQDLELARQAEQAAQQRTAFGAGLFETGAGLLGQQYGLQTQALSPFQTQFGLSQLLEQAAQQPLDIGAQLGGRSATAGANVGQTLLAGGLGAAQTQMQGNIMGQALRSNALSDILGNKQLQQGLFGGAQQMMSPLIYGSSNVYGPYGTGTVPTLNASPTFGSAGYYATDI